MKLITISLMTFAVMGAAHAQSSIECNRANDGSFKAALIWQNTLGVERANMICQRHGLSMIQPKDQVMPSGVTYQHNGGKAPKEVVESTESRFSPVLVESAMKEAQAKSVSSKEATQAQETFVQAAVPPDPGYSTLSDLATSSSVIQPGYTRMQ